jgi:hypothetical protein
MIQNLLEEKKRKSYSAKAGGKPVYKTEGGAGKASLTEDADQDTYSAPSAPPVTLKPSEVYLFKPTSRQDDKSARIFMERIRDAKKVYKSHPEKLVLLLPRCLDNDIAHTWYTALSDLEKDEMAAAPANWENTLRRDFMGTDTQLRLAADREHFRWSQGRTPAEYVDEKVGKLRLAGMASDDNIVERIYDGFYATPPLQAALAVYTNSSLRQFRGYIRQIQDIYKRMHEDSAPAKKDSRVAPRQSGFARDQAANASRPSDGMKPADQKLRPPYGAERKFNVDPPRPCRKCSEKGLSANHWIVDCPLRNEKKEKGFVGKTDSDSSDDGAGPRYKRKQRAYLAIQEHQETLNEPDDEDSDDDPATNDEIVANFGVACRECKEPFTSGNKLHDHLKSFNAHAVDSDPIVIDLTAQPKGDYPEGISNCTETRMKAYLAADATSLPHFTAVVDSGFGRSAVNRRLLTSIPHTVKTIRRLVIRGIGGRQAVTEIAEFVFYLRSTQGAFLKLRIAALIFDDLGTDLLISTDYIMAWNIVLDIPRQLAVFHHTNKAKSLATVCLQVNRQPSINIVVRVAKNTVIPASSLGQVPIRLNYSGKADLLFTSSIAEVPDGILSAAQPTLGYLNEGPPPLTVKRGTILGTASAVNGGNFAFSPQATKALNGFLELNSHKEEASCGAGRKEKDEADKGYEEGQLTGLSDADRVSLARLS